MQKHLRRFRRANILSKDRKRNWGNVTVHVGSFASGRKLVVDEEIWDELRDNFHDKCTAVEMESEGVTFATENHPVECNWLVIKGVMDLASNETRDGGTKDD